MTRIKKIRVTQFLLLISGLLIVYFTYYNDKSSKDLNNLSKENILKKKYLDKDDAINVFYNIKYNGIDLSGNRYVLTSEEAIIKKDNEDLLYLTGVNYVFYLKDDSILKVISTSGEYNNKSLDMKFKENVLMTYNDNILKAEYAEFSNSGNYLQIMKNVEVKSEMGNIYADKFFFDLKNKKFSLDSFENNNINANIKINEKRF